MKSLKFKYAGKVVKMEETSHAALFRTFFDHWKKTDLEKTIFGTFESGLRLSDNEYFEGTVIKKKNYEVSEDLYIITHITPQAMDKGIFGFLEAVGAEIIDPKPLLKKKDEPKETPKAKQPKKEETHEQTLEEIKQIAAQAGKQTPKLDSKNSLKINSSMAEMVRKKMKERDEAIKARLAGGPNKAHEA